MPSDSSGKRIGLIPPFGGGPTEAKGVKGVPPVGCDQLGYDLLFRVWCCKAKDDLPRKPLRKAGICYS